MTVGDCWIPPNKSVACTKDHTALTLATYPDADLPMSWEEAKALAAQLNAITPDSDRPKEDIARIDDFNAKMKPLIAQCMQAQRDVLDLSVPGGGYRSTLFVSVIETSSKADWDAGNHTAWCDISLGLPEGDDLRFLPTGDLPGAAQLLHNQHCQTAKGGVFCDSPADSWMTVITDRPMPDLGSTPTTEKAAQKRLNRYCLQATLPFVANGQQLTAGTVNSGAESPSQEDESSLLALWDDPDTTIFCGIPNWASNLR